MTIRERLSSAYQSVPQYAKNILGITLAWFVVLQLFGVLLFGAISYGENTLSTPNEERAPRLLEAPARWDSGYYTNIAERGYQGPEDTHLAFFPAYPLMLRAMASVGLSYGFAALLINVVSLTIANISLFKITKKLLAKDRLGYVTVLLFLAFPSSFFMNAVYGEAMYMALALTSFWFAQNRRWGLACILLAFASAVRLPAAMLVAAVGFEYIASHNYNLRRLFNRDLLWFMVAPLGLISYLAYQYARYADPLAFHAVYALGWEYQVFSANIPKLLWVELKRAAYHLIVLRQPLAPEMMHLPSWCMALFTIVLGIKKRVKLSPGMVFFTTSSLVLFSLNSNLVSSQRYILTLFPIFIALAQLIGSHAKLLRLWLTISFVMCLAYYLRFINFHFAG